jgi:hypothetical protein
MSNKRFFKFTERLLMAAMLCVSVFMTSCESNSSSSGSSDSDGGVLDVKTLLGRSFRMQKDHYGSNIETTYYQIAFKNTYFVNVHIWGNGIDEDGTYRWDNGTVDCNYTLSGNTMTINFEGTNDHKETITIQFRNGMPVGWQESEKVAIDADAGSGEAKGGTSDMFGYYSSDYFRKYIDDELVFVGKDLGRLNDLTGYVGNGYRIVDASTIWFIYERFHYREWSITNGYIYQRKTWRDSYGNTATLCYYLDTEPYEVHKYYMVGSTLVVNGTDLKLEYSNGKLSYGGQYGYTKK